MTAPSSTRSPILQMIIGKVRRLTGTANSFQLPDVPDASVPYSFGITDYINSFYNYDFPEKYRALKLKDKYTFDTLNGIDTYAFDSNNYTTVEMPCYCAKREIALFQDPWSFYAVNFNWQSQTNFSSGDGTTGARTGSITAATNAANCQVTSANHGLVTGSVITISGVGGMTELNGNTFTITVVDNNNFLLNVNSTAFGVYTTGGTWTSSAYDGFTSAKPIIRSVNNNPTNLNYPVSRVQNILITANTAIGTANVTDDGNGNLIGDCTSGTINYTTGAITNLNFTSVIPQGNSIQIQYNPFQSSIPLSILFFQNQFTLRPVPDRGYTIELVAYRTPSQALANTASFQGTPELNEWWECIAVGAAKKIYEDRLDADGITMMDKMLAERYNIIESRTYGQLGKQRISTLFADQLQYNYGQGAGFFGSV